MCVCVAAAQSQGYTRTRIPFFFLSFYSSITKSGDVAQHETHFDLSLHPNSDREYCFLFLVIRLPRCARVNSFRRLSDLPYQIKLSSVPNYCVVTCWNHCTRSVSLVFSVVFFFLRGLMPATLPFEFALLAPMREKQRDGISYDCFTYSFLVFCVDGRKAAARCWPII